MISCATLLLHILNGTKYEDRVTQHEQFLNQAEILPSLINVGLHDFHIINDTECMASACGRLRTMGSDLYF